MLMLACLAALYRDITALTQRIEGLRLAEPATAQKLEDWRAWLDVVDEGPYISALRLKEDRGRARTHLIFEQSVYTPRAGPLARDKFKIVKCSVFRMSDVLTEIERIMGLNPGEGIEYCEDLLQERAGGLANAVHFLALRFCNNVASHLHGRECMVYPACGACTQLSYCR